jgi:hypothetical protein
LEIEGVLTADYKPLILGVTPCNVKVKHCKGQVMHIMAAKEGYNVEMWYNIPEKGSLDHHFDLIEKDAQNNN